jgi:hypothetical protein
MTAQNRDEVREFLTTRRAKVQPHQVGLAPGTNRRVPGLRRTEAALLAGVSVEYYSRLERGDLAGASDAVLHGIALEEAEREHLFDLARAVNASPAQRKRRSPRTATARSSLQLALDAITGGPALVRNGRMDIIAANVLGRRSTSTRMPLQNGRSTWPGTPSWTSTRPSSSTPTGTPRPMRSSRSSVPKRAAMRTTGTSRALLVSSQPAVSRSGRSGATTISAAMPPASSDSAIRPSATSNFCSGTELMADAGWTLLIYSAEPGTPTEERVRLLASWAATQEQANAPAATEPTSQMGR